MSQPPFISQHSLCLYSHPIFNVTRKTFQHYVSAIFQFISQHCLRSYAHPKINVTRKTFQHYVSAIFQFISPYYLRSVPAGSPSGGGDVVDYVKNINQPSLLTPFYSVLVSTSVLKALSTVFHSINSLDNSPLSHSFLPVLILSY